MEAVYPDFPDETVEYSFEELRALRRGWLNKAWTPAQSPLRSISGNSQKRGKPLDVTLSDIENLTHEFKDTSLINTSTQSIVGMPGSKPTKARRMKIREVKQETQTGKFGSVGFYCDPQLMTRKNSEDQVGITHWKKIEAQRLCGTYHDFSQ